MGSIKDAELLYLYYRREMIVMLLNVFLVSSVPCNLSILKSGFCNPINHRSFWVKHKNVTINNKDTYIIFKISFGTHKWKLLTCFCRTYVRGTFKLMRQHSVHRLTKYVTIALSDQLTVVKFGSIPNINTVIKFSAKIQNNVELFFRT